MFSYQQIARWLTFPIDPITVEDWVANREIFGEGKGEEELEDAYQVEKLRELGETAGQEDMGLFLLLNGVEASGVIDRKDYLVIAPAGRVSFEGKKIAEVKMSPLTGGKTEKMSVFSGEVLVKELDPTVSLKIQVNPGRLSWTGAGKKVLVLDGRGRPLPDLGPGVKQQETMKKLRSI